MSINSSSSLFRFRFLRLGFGVAAAVAVHREAGIALPPKHPRQLRLLRRGAPGAPGARGAAPRRRAVRGCAMRETYNPVVRASDRAARERLEARVEAVELLERAAEARPQLPVLVQQADLGPPKLAVFCN